MTLKTSTNFALTSRTPPHPQTSRLSTSSSRSTPKASHGPVWATTLHLSSARSSHCALQVASIPRMKDVSTRKTQPIGLTPPTMQVAPISTLPASSSAPSSQPLKPVPASSPASSTAHTCNLGATSRSLQENILRSLHVRIRIRSTNTVDTTSRLRSSH